MASSKRDAVAPHALHLPIFTKLRGKRVILASASPRRRQILETFGLRPEVVQSRFEENLPHGQFDVAGPGEDGAPTPPAAKGMAYAVATSTEKAVEVYRRLVADKPEDPPDLIISADTVVVSVPSSSTGDSLPAEATILEKPLDASDNLEMLLNLAMPARPRASAGGPVELADSTTPRCEVVTGVSVVYPSLQYPGYKVETMAESTRIWFGDLTLAHLQAYVDSGEGLDRAGGFAIQGLGGHLVRRIDGDYNNVVGFPAYAFVRFLERLMKHDDDFLAD